MVILMSPYNNPESWAISQYKPDLLDTDALKLAIKYKALELKYPNENLDKLDNLTRDQHFFTSGFYLGIAWRDHKGDKDDNNR